MFSASAGNRFRANTYRVLDPSAAYWGWNEETVTWVQWQAFGQDARGAVKEVEQPGAVRAPGTSHLP